MSSLDIYEYLANALIKTVSDVRAGNWDGRYVFLPSHNGEFGFIYREDYSGLMADNPTRRKQGLFDFRVLTGDRYEGGVTHRDILSDISDYTTVDNCKKIWRGISPKTITGDDDELEVLTTLALLMFEQEVNWGNEEWQKWSNFKPYVTRPHSIRPRDMLMGFVLQAEKYGIDDIKYWMLRKPGTVCFGSPDGSNHTYNDYPAEYKRFFNQLQNDPDAPPESKAKALMVGDIRKRFRLLADKFGDNPRYSSRR